MCGAFLLCCADGFQHGGEDFLFPLHDINDAERFGILAALLASPAMPLMIIGLAILRLLILALVWRKERSEQQPDHTAINR